MQDTRMAVRGGTTRSEYIFKFHVSKISRNKKAIDRSLGIRKHFSSSKSSSFFGCDINISEPPCSEREYPSPRVEANLWAFSSFLLLSLFLPPSSLFIFLSFLHWRDSINAGPPWFPFRTLFMIRDECHNGNEAFEVGV